MPPKNGIDTYFSQNCILTKLKKKETCLLDIILNIIKMKTILGNFKQWLIFWIKI